MTELINELNRTKSGLYNLKIRTVDGRQLVDVTNITRAQARKICVIIRSEDNRKPVVLETWRYWEIVGELRWMGADYPQAVDAAKWAQRAKPGEINQVNLFVDERLLGEILPRYRKIEEIEMEVKDG